MNGIQRIFVGCVALLAVAFVSPAWAQLFGSNSNRALRQPLARQQGFSQFKDAGTLSGSERYIRRNRRATDFVGPDLRELRRFIGAIQGRATGRVVPMTQSLRKPADRSASMNQQLAPAARGQLYNPRLTLGFQAPAVNSTGQAAHLQDVLASSPHLSANRIEVSLEGRTAILRGEVLSAKDRDLAQILASFEPGISAVDNQLRIVQRSRVSDPFGAPPTGARPDASPQTPSTPSTPSSTRPAKEVWLRLPRMTPADAR